MSNTSGGGDPWQQRQRGRSRLWCLGHIMANWEQLWQAKAEEAVRRAESPR
ncbi:MAG TPA: hypothetical protein VK780_09755 [Thermoanaerobaculia bacterium]|nr:hypothetical protein [Thermoanaerobaculia bacterium]